MIPSNFFVCEGLLTLTATSINMKEPQPHDIQNWIIEPSDYRCTTESLSVCLSSTVGKLCLSLSLLNG